MLVYTRLFSYFIKSHFITIKVENTKPLDDLKVVKLFAPNFSTSAMHRGIHQGKSGPSNADL